MKASTTMHRLGVVLLSAMAFVATSAQASFYWFNKPIYLSVQQPVSNYWYVPTQMSSGWPLSVKLTMLNEEGIAAYNGSPTFPMQGNQGYVVFSDPDGCLTIFPSFIEAPGCDPSQPLPPSDETYFEFTPDIDIPGRVDFSGNDTIQPLQTDAMGGGAPVFNSVDLANEATTRRLGPITNFTDADGNEVIDGYGIGTPDDDIPGLVILADTGVGVKLDADFNPGAVRTNLNLAGLVNSVSYELSNVYLRTTVTAHMNVPKSTFAPFVKVDNCVGDPTTCDQPSLWRIDGGALETAPDNNEIVKEAYPVLFEDRTTVIRIFAVSGTAPGEIADENGDGVIDHRDATEMGYNVISNQAKVRVKQLHGDPCFAGMNSILFEDFDGNGAVGLGIVCPAGAGGLSRVPR